MKHLTPQQQIIIEALRCKDWVCQTAWLGKIKDDRKRISELNEGYMKEKGYEIIGKPCDGRCGKSHPSRLFMRRAQKLGVQSSNATTLPTKAENPNVLSPADQHYWETCAA